MDEEFIGGTTLQGHCSNFRGKLCVWAHLLKVTPENSKALVNKLVPPKQAGSTTYDKIIANVEVDSLGGTKAAAASPKSSFAGASQGQDGAPTSVEPQQANPKTAQKGNSHPESTTPQKKRTDALQNKDNTGRPSSRPRPGSSGRGKQVPFKESRGPNKKGIGFKDGPGKRTGSNGLNRWKKIVSSKSSTQGNQAKQENQAKPSQYVPSGDGAAQLKAMLGVGAAAPFAALPAQAPDASAGLKAMLGLGDSPSLQQIPDPPLPPPEMVPPAPPLEPTSAADKLFAMMRAKPPQGPAPVHPSPPASSFNFTYVKEGEVPLPAPSPMMPHQMPMQQYPPNNFHGYGFPPAPPPHMMPSPPIHMQRATMPVVSNGPSVEEFPPLGTSPNPKNITREKIEEKKTSGDGNLMVPSAVASRSRK